MDFLQKQKIIEHAKVNESITIRDIIELLNVTKKRAQELLQWLIETQDLILKPKTKTKYQLNKEKHP